MVERARVLWILQKGQRVGFKLSHWDSTLPGPLHDTSSPAGMIPHLADSQVAPSNPCSGDELHMPSLCDHVAYWKAAFDSLVVPKHKCLTHVVGWARTLGCSNDHKLIASCLNFLDVEVQVSTMYLRPNSLFYLRSLWHFLEKKSKDSPGLSNHNLEGFGKADGLLSTHRLFIHGYS